MNERLKRVAELQGRGKNAIITDAICAYLKTAEQQELVREARRRSELASQCEAQDDWIHFTDPSLWK